jgi:transcriptional regulator with XRE-family HTH domain
MERRLKKTLTAIAQETGISLSHLSRIFSGKRQPSWENAQAIAASLGISTDELAVKLGVDHASHR